MPFFLSVSRNGFNASFTSGRCLQNYWGLELTEHADAIVKILTHNVARGNIEYRPREYESMVREAKV